MAPEASTTLETAALLISNSGRASARDNTAVQRSALSRRFCSASVRSDSSHQPSPTTESDGAANVHHFPGTFYDYRWSTTLARRDTINTNATDRRASGPDGNGGLTLVPGDFRELQGTMWFHDHRFFFLMGVILARLDQMELARSSIEVAIQLSSDPQQQSRYRSKLQRLRPLS